MVGEWVFADQDFISAQQAESYVEPINSVYEVLRIVDGIPLFFEDHYRRLENSCNTFNHKPHIYNELKNVIKVLVEKNSISESNLKIEYRFYPEGTKMFVYQIAPVYPSIEMYQNGVKLKTFRAERPNPNVKQAVINNKIRNQTHKIIRSSEDLYDVALVNDRNEVTEGSKTNLFFVNGNTIYTAPRNQILEGITWLKVLQIAKKHQLNIIEKPIAISTLNSFSGCFLTGTSPKVLPVSSLDNITYDVQHKHIQLIMMEYNAMINENISLFKWD